VIDLQVVDAEYNVYTQSVRCQLLVTFRNVDTNLPDSFISSFEIPLQFAEELAIRMNRSVVPLPALEGAAWTLN
jgi:hypothetical protein